MDIFTKIQRGKRLVREKQISGTIPYVSSTAMNNGIDNFIKYDKKNMRKYCDCISIANSGSVGNTFYQSSDYIASDHVTNLKNNNFSKFIYLFIATITNRLSKKYNFNREISDTRISREKIIFPVNNDYKPDYKYMEEHIKKIMLQKYNKYLEYVKDE